MIVLIPSFEPDERLLSLVSDLVLGARRFSGRVPLHSRIGNATIGAVFRLATGTSLVDTQTGLRGYPHRLLGWLLAVPGDRFEYELNVLLLASKERLGNPRGRDRHHLPSWQLVLPLSAAARLPAQLLAVAQLRSIFAGGIRRRRRGTVGAVSADRQPRGRCGHRTATERDRQLPAQPSSGLLCPRSTVMAGCPALRTAGCRDPWREPGADGGADPAAGVPDHGQGNHGDVVVPCQLWHSAAPGLHPVTDPQSVAQKSAVTLRRGKIRRP